MPIQLTQLDLYLRTLLGDEPDETLIEIRTRKPRSNSMRNWFIDVGAQARLHELLPAIAKHSDVYIGVAPRRTADGTRDGITHAHVVWADVDGPDGARTVATFDPHPSMIVRSGSRGGVHAYWALDRATDVATVEAINRALAEAVDGDAVWAATTILRVPGTLNHKHDPPRAVELERATGEVFDSAALLAALPEPEPAKRFERSRTPREVGTDRLMTIPPREYVSRLLGVEVPRSGFVTCPFHRDRTPSLKVYDEADRGWCCFGRCGRKGGSIYDLAGRLFNLDTRGEDFLEIRRRLLEMFT